MLGVAIPVGAIYFPATRRRTEVAFDDTLREETFATIARLRVVLGDIGALPPPVNDRLCPNCSLNDACVPAVIHAAREARLAETLFTPCDGLKRR